MLWTFSVILLSIWIVGVATPFTLHGYIHLLPALAVAVMLAPFIHKRRVSD